MKSFLFNQAIAHSKEEEKKNNFILNFNGNLSATLHLSITCILSLAPYVYGLRRNSSIDFHVNYFSSSLVKICC